MVGLNIFYQRRRKLLARVGALLLLVLGGLLAVMPLPRADANESPATVVREAVKADAMRLMLAPEPLSSQRFLAYYAQAYH